uniref:Uncharacterized protein n=1 Tax=Aegilops tauschii subsp. strangulata TaxID=200361 RepID=A0A453QKY1_AEGTS
MTNASMKGAYIIFKTFRYRKQSFWIQLLTDSPQLTKQSQENHLRFRCSFKVAIRPLLL